MDAITTVAIIDGILLVTGFSLELISHKYKVKNENARKTVWKLVEYTTMGLVGYQFGGGA